MKTLSSTLCATAMAFSIAAGGATTASAGPAQTPTTADITQTTVQEYGNHLRNKRFVRRGDHAYYGGHRGYRHKRRGYRQHNGYWFPPAAFLGGVIIGNIISQDRGRYYGDDGYRLHVRWCDNRYRSYRVSDDTFQPYHGPRRRCNSPYN